VEQVPRLCFQWSRGGRRKSRRLKRKTPERPLRAHQPDRFSSHVLVMADPHSTPCARETASTSRARSAFRAAAYQACQASSPRTLQRYGLAALVPQRYRVFSSVRPQNSPPLHRIYPNLSQLPAKRQLNAQDTRNYLAHRRCCGTHPRSRFSPGPKPKNQLSRKFDAARFCILHITIEY